MSVVKGTESSANEEIAWIHVRRIDHIGRWRRIVNPDRSRDTDPDDDCCLHRRRPTEADEDGEGSEQGVSRKNGHDLPPGSIRNMRRTQTAH
jgi:hypothetical protein